MDYHLDRALRAKISTENKSLYGWSIGEVDADGKQVGSDQIPWHWRLYFTAVEIIVGDGIDLKIKYGNEGERDGLEVSQRRIIRAKLRPGDVRHDDVWARQTTYRMFGTDRAIKSFQVDILPLTDPDASESCESWGSPSYTAEIDFRNDTTEDCVIFYLMVRPETFDRYIAALAAGADEIVLSVGMVDGFYSEWSPSISTRDVKVLCPGDSHKVALPKGIAREPLTLGLVGEAELSVNYSRVVIKPPANDDGDAPEVVAVAPEAARQRTADPQILKMLTSIRTAAWIVAAAVVITAVRLVLR